jgi:hypothetical protein
MRASVTKRLLCAARPVAVPVDWRTAAAFGLPCILYLLTLAPTIYNLDSAELTTAAATGGLMRATGYPLYLLLGHIWSQLPIGDVGYRMNLFSAFNGALTIALLERILRRLHVGAWACAGALGLLACSTFFWALSLIAEVYTLQTTLMAGLILLLLRLAEEPTPNRLMWVGLLIGLILGHHGGSMLLMPGVIWYLASIGVRQVLAPRALLGALLALAAGLSVFLYLPLRYAALPAFNYAGVYDASGTFHPIDLRELSGFWWLISGQSFHRMMFAYSPGAAWHEMAWFGAQLWRAFFAIGIGPGLLGLSVLLRRDWKFGIMTLLMFGAHTIFFVNYRALDKETMFLPAYLIWALWLGVGYQWLIDWSSRSIGKAAQEWARRLVGAAIVLAVVVAAAWNWRLVDRADDRSARDLGESILRSVKPHALIFGYWQTVPLVDYLRLVEGQRPDVQTINRVFMSPQDLRRLIRRAVLERPVYIDQVPDDLRPQLDVTPAGPVYYLRPKTRARSGGE